MARWLFALSFGFWSAPAEANPSCAPEGAPLVLAQGAPAWARAELAQLGTRTAVAWIEQDTAKVAVLGRYGFALAPAQPILAVGDTAAEVAVVTWGEGFVVLAVREPGRRREGCELIGRNLTMDGALRAPVVLATGTCGDTPRRLLVTVGHSSILVAYGEEAAAGGALRLVRWVPGEPLAPPVEVAPGPLVELEDLAPFEEGFVLAYRRLGEHLGVTRLMHQDGGLVGSELRDWIPGAFWLGRHACVASGRGTDVWRVGVPPHGEIRRVAVPVSAGHVTPLRTGGRVWLLLSTTSGRRILPVNESAMVVGPQSVPVAPTRAVFGSVRLAIDGVDGAASWLERSRLVWQRLRCHD